MKWTEKINKKYMQISLYVIITAVIIYCLTLLAGNVPYLAKKAMFALAWILQVITPVIIGFVFAYLMDPIVAFFEKKIRKLKFFRKVKRPRNLAALISVFILFMAILGLISLLVFSVTDQLRLANFDDIVRLSEEFVNSINVFYQNVLNKLGELDIQSEEIENYVTNVAQIVFNGMKSFIEGIITSVTNISSYLTTIIFSFIIGFYFIIDGNMIMEYNKKVSKALLGPKTNRIMQRAIGDIDYVFSGYLRGQLADAFIMMILISLTLSITGVKFALVIGVFAGIGNLIPYFGPVVAYVGTIVVCLINGEISTMVIALIALLIIQFVDGNFIGPKLLSHSIQIHPLIVIISLIFGSAVGGFMGMLLAVPVGAYIKMVFVRYIDRRLEKKESLERSMKSTEDNSKKIKK